jgi:hypothetical protein
MAKSSTKFDVMLAEITEKVKASGSKSSSRGDIIKVATALINEPTQSFETFVAGPDGKPTGVDHRPVEDYRNQLKLVLGQFGIDKAEQARLDTLVFSKAHAESVFNLGQWMTHAYLSTGRKLIMPGPTKNASQFHISTVDAEEKKIPTRVITTDDQGNKSSQLTGKISITKAHKAIKAGNKIPAWLKSVK